MRRVIPRVSGTPPGWRRAVPRFPKPRFSIPVLTEFTTNAPTPAPTVARAGREGDDLRNSQDIATIQALRAGELDPDTAWADLIGRHRRRLFSLAYRFTGQYQEAEELTQEIIVRVYRQLDRFDPRAHFAVWLNSVARNYCIDHYRMKVRERQRLLPEEAHLERAPGSALLAPDRLLEAREARTNLLAALDGLSPKLREVVQLRFFQEMPYEEICERLGVPEGTVKSRIHRGRAELKRLLLAARKPPGRPPGSIPGRRLMS